MELNDEILIRFLNGACDTKELQAVTDWLAADLSHAYALFHLESVYRSAEASTMSSREVSLRLRSLMRRLEAEDLRKQRAITRRRWWRWAAVVAGVIFLGALGFWLSGSNSPLHASDMLIARTTGDKPRVVRLADGSAVWLKAGSELRYPHRFSQKERRVELQGEAYFEVTKNRYQPFVVSGKAVDVKVLGTKFVFSINGNGHLATVSLIEGSVEVRDVKRDARLLLKPRQRVTLNTVTGQQRVENMDTRLAAAWHNNLIPFTNANVKDIAHTLEQLYGVKVNVSDNVDLTQTFSGAVFLAPNIDSVLSLIRSTVPINYHRRGSEVWITSD